MTAREAVTRFKQGNLPKLEQKEIGTIYFDDKAVEPCLRYCGTTLTIGDTVPGKEITWVVVGDLLVAADCLCLNISQHVLNDMGYVDGTVVKIDGKLYLCRLIKGGVTRNAPNEWDDFLSIDKSNLLRNSIYLFWAQESFVQKETGLKRCVVRTTQYKSLIWDARDGTEEDGYVGFRPLLEPLLPSQNKEHPKMVIKVPGTALVGALVGQSDYDLFLKPETTVRNCGAWGVKQRNGVIVIGKKRILWSETI